MLLPSVQYKTDSFKKPCVWNIVTCFFCFLVNQLKNILLKWWPVKHREIICSSNHDYWFFVLRFWSKKYERYVFFFFVGLELYLFCVNEYSVFTQLVYKEPLKWGEVVPPWIVGELLACSSDLEFSAWPGSLQPPHLHPAVPPNSLFNMPAAFKPFSHSLRWSTSPPSCFTSISLASSPKTFWLPERQGGFLLCTSKTSRSHLIEALALIGSCLYLLHKSVGNFGERSMFYT